MSFKIHPGIGIARVGNSESKFVGPVTANEPDHSVGYYKDDQCRIRRQGARFEVWQHADDGTPIAPVDPALETVSWTVRVALTGSGAPPALTVTGMNQSLKQMVSPFIELETDGHGRLIVYGKVLPDQTDVMDDGTGDGYVHATLVASNQTASPSWLVLAPPDFAPAMRPLQSVCDKVSQLLAFDDGMPTSFRRHIYPILRAGSDLKVVRTEPEILTPALVAELPNLSGPAARQQVKDLFGVAPSALTAQQDQRLTDWVNAAFDDDSAELGAPLPLTPIELDRGPLDHCLQGDTGWDIGPNLTTNASVYMEPFRLDPDQVTFGFARFGLAPNWQLDLPECAQVWPAQTTLLTGLQNPANNWVTRGFVERDGEGELFVDDQCGTITRGSRPEIHVSYNESGRRILIILGGGLGDGVVVVMGPHGPVIIGPGDPLHDAAAHVTREAGRELASIAKRALSRRAAHQRR